MKPLITNQYEKALRETIARLDPGECLTICFVNSAVSVSVEHKGGYGQSASLRSTEETGNDILDDMAHLLRTGLV